MDRGCKKTTFAAIAAIVLVVIAGCNGNVGLNHSQDTEEKLAKSDILKQSWIHAPIPMYISTTVPEEFRSAIIDSMEKWNDEAGVELLDYVGLTESEERTYDGSNVIYWDDNDSENGYFGETFTQWVNDTVLIEGDIVFYGDPDEFAVLSCEDDGEVCKSLERKKDVVTTTLHELGHVLGFVHTSGRTDLMNPHFTYGDVHQHIGSDLLAELTDIYEPEFVAEK